jgi:hypothetical protein
MVKQSQSLSMVNVVAKSTCAKLTNLYDLLTNYRMTPQMTIKGQINELV